MTGPRIAKSENRPSAARRTLLAGGVAGLAAVAGTALGRSQSVSAQTTDPSITDWINVTDPNQVTNPADPTGQRDSQPGIQQAIDIAAAQLLDGIYTGGVVYLPTGVYRVNETVAYAPTPPAIAPVYIRGAGPQSTTIKYYGSNDCISMYQNYHPSGGASGILAWGGGISDLTIEGGNSTAGSVGLHVGDMKYAEFRRINIRHFNKQTSIGAWLDNRAFWTEDCTFEFHLEDNATGVVMDVSGANATSAHDNCRYEFGFAGYNNENGATIQQSGVVIRNGANPYHSRFWIHGGIASAPNTTPPTTPGVLLQVGTSSTDNAQIDKCELIIEMESDGSNPVTPQTIVQGPSGNNQISGCWGRLRFLDGYKAASLNAEFSFDGPIAGDTVLAGLTPSGTPTSGDVYTNKNPPVMMIVTGGAVNDIFINSSQATGLTSGAFYIPMYGTYRINYSTSNPPTVVWVSMCPG